MLNEDAVPGQGNRDERKESSSVADLSRLAIGTACEVLGGLAGGSAEAFQTAKAHIDVPKPNLVQGLLQGNARFLEHMSHTMDAVAKNFRSRRSPGRDTEDPTV